MVSDIFEKARELGVELSLDGDRIRMSKSIRDGDPIPQGFKNAIRERKAEIVDLLSGRHEDRAPVGIGMKRGCGYIVLTRRDTGESARVEDADLPAWFFAKVNAAKGGDWQPPAVPDHRPPALPQHVVEGLCLECGSRDDFDAVSELCRQCLANEPWA